MNTYQNGGDKAFYQGGKDAVIVYSIFIGGAKMLLEKAKDGIENSADEVAENLVRKASRKVTKTLQHKPSWKPERVIEAVEGKTTTLIGNYKKDMQQILSELNYPKSADFGPKPGGFNLLNVPDGYDPLKFLEEYNLPWLKSAIERGDDIMVMSDLFDNNLLFKNSIKTGFGHEVEFMNELVKQGKYEFIETTGKYIPKK